MESGRQRTALITGASAGIGKAFAEELAGKGFHLALTARRIDRLRDLGTKLQERYGVQVMAVGADLADPESPRMILHRVGEWGRQVDVLVNNAGFGVPERFVKVDWERHSSFIQVLVTAVCEMTHRVLPGMIERRYGRIVNVASVAGLLPGGAGSTLYAGAKSFLIKFTESLWLELEGTGVNVTAACPGMTYSEFHDVSGTRAKVSRLPSYMWMDAVTVARQALDAVEKNRPVRVHGGVNRLLAGAVRFVPDRLARDLSRRQSRRFDSY